MIKDSSGWTKEEGEEKKEGNLNQCSLVVEFFFSHSWNPVEWCTSVSTSTFANYAALINGFSTDGWTEGTKKKMMACGVCRVSGSAELLRAIITGMCELTTFFFPVSQEMRKECDVFTLPPQSPTRIILKPILLLLILFFLPHLVLLGTSYPSFSLIKFKCEIYKYKELKL